MKLKEYNVIASSVRLDEIPPQYRELPLLGRGATSLAFEKNANTVIVFTRDLMKVEWLKNGLSMVHNQQIVHPVRWHHIPGMQKHDLVMIEMPKLYPLDAVNKSRVIKETNAFTRLMINHRLSRLHQGSWHTKLNKIIEDFVQVYPRSQILPFLEWILDYDPKDFFLDIGPRQFKQTSKGKIVLLDPVVAADLLKLLQTKGR
jgi:hypothetical protein